MLAIRDQEQLERVVEAVLRAFGDGTVGVYLHGSAVEGLLRKESDLDVMVVVNGVPTEAQKRGLVAELLEISGGQGQSSRPVDLTVVRRADVQPWRFPTPRQLQYGEWLRRQFQEGGDDVFAPVESADVALLLEATRRLGVPLYGPPPTAVLDPIPKADVQAANRRGVTDVLEEIDTDTRNVLLTLARSWYTAATGQVTTKDAAASWALNRLPDEHHHVLVTARAAYVGESNDDWNDLLIPARAAATHLAASARSAAQA